MYKNFKKSISIWNKQNRNLKIVSIRSIFNRFFQRLTIDYDSIYISKLGADPTQLGIVNGFSNIVKTLSSIIIGWLQDRYSLRKIFLIGAGLSLLVNLIFFLAIDWVMIIPAMMLSSLVMIIGSCLTICDVSLKDEERSIFKGICDGVFATPSLIAPTISAFIITYFGGISVDGIRPLYAIQFFSGVILLVYLLMQLKEIERQKRNFSSFFKEYREVFNRGTALKRFIVFSIMSAFSTGLITPFIPLFAYEVKGADQFVLGVMTMAGLFTQIVFSTQLGNLADNMGRKKLIYLVEPLYWLSLLVLIFSPSSIFLIISSFFGGFKIILEYISITPLKVCLVPIDCIGRWRGILGFFEGLASILAPIIGGLIWEYLGPSYLILMPLFIDLVIRVPLLTTIPERMRKKGAELWE